MPTSGHFTLENDKIVSAPQISVPKASETYRYYVFNYSDEYYASSDRLLWHVFDIKNSNEIVVYDEIITNIVDTGDIR